MTTQAKPVWVPFKCSKCGKTHHMTESTFAEIGHKPCACGGTWTAPPVKAAAK